MLAHPASDWSIVRICPPRLRSAFPKRYAQVRHAQSPALRSLGGGGTCCPPSIGRPPMRGGGTPMMDQSDAGSAGIFSRWTNQVAPRAPPVSSHSLVCMSPPGCWFRRRVCAMAECRPGRRDGPHDRA
eukprot:3198549-Pyramimonas_sp.AAC.1